MCDSLQPHGLQHARPPCPSPTPGACSNSCPSSWWCNLTISSSVIPFSSWLQSIPASGSFPMSQFFASGGQSIGASASASVWTTLINNIHQRLMREGTNIRLPKYSIPFDLAPSVASQRNCIIPCLISLLCIWIMGKLNPYPSLLQLLNYSECVQKGPLLSSCLLESNPSVNYT